MLERIALTVVLTFVVALVAGCNTVEGAGQDIEAAGQEIKETAD